eukprot:1181228-Prorocentrum_minimum.AAC.1
MAIGPLLQSSCFKGGGGARPWGVPLGRAPARAERPESWGSPPRPRVCACATLRLHTRWSHTARVPWRAPVTTVRV